MIIIGILVIGLVVWFITTQGKNNRSESVSNALDIAKARYAKGEITKDEFEQIKKIL